MIIYMYISIINYNFVRFDQMLIRFFLILSLFIQDTHRLKSYYFDAKYINYIIYFPDTRIQILTQEFMPKKMYAECRVRQFYHPETFSVEATEVIMASSLLKVVNMI